MQQVQDMRFGWYSSFQRQFYGPQNGAFVMV